MPLTKGLLTSVAFHTLFGATPELLLTSMNFLEPFIMEFANQSYYDHYDHLLTPTGFSFLWSILATLQTISCLLTALLYTWLLDRLGRKVSYMYIKNVMLVIACVLHIISKPLNSFECLVLARLVTGVSMALCHAPATVFVAECSPDDYRAQTTQMLGVGHAGWGVIAGFLALPFLFGNEKQWPYVFVIAIPFAITHFLSSFVIPRSPKYLYLKRKDVPEARKSLQFYYGNDCDEATLFARFDQEAHLADHGLSLSSIWSKAHLRKPLIICTIAHIAPTLGGQQLVLEFGIPILIWLGFPQGWAILIGLVTTIFSLAGIFVLSLFIIHKVSRRWLYLSSLGAQMLGLCCYMTAGWGIDGEKFGLENPGVELSNLTVVFTVFATICVIYFMSVHPTYLAMLFLSELCPQGIRAKVTQVSSVLFFILSIVVSLIIPPLITAIGSIACMIFAFFGLICIVWLWRNLPETRVGGVEEIVAGFQQQSSEHEPLMSSVEGY